MLQAARADSVAALRALPGVTVVLRDAELKQRHEASRIWKESWLSAFFHKPCNHELFVLQSLNMEGRARQQPGAAVQAPVASQVAHAERSSQPTATCTWSAVGIGMAQRDGVDWLLHVDTDELIYPSGSPDFSLQVRFHSP